MSNLTWETKGRTLHLTVGGRGHSQSWTLRPTTPAAAKAEILERVLDALWERSPQRHAEGLEHLPRQSDIPPPPIALQASAADREDHLPSNYGALLAVERRLRGNASWADGDEETAEAATRGLTTVVPHEPETAALSGTYQLPAVGDPEIAYDRIRERPSVFDPDWRIKDTR